MGRKNEIEGQMNFLDMLTEEPAKEEPVAKESSMDEPVTEKPVEEKSVKEEFRAGGLPGVCFLLVRHLRTQHGGRQCAKTLWGKYAPLSLLRPVCQRRAGRRVRYRLCG